jgi:hypothetical protein
MYYFEPYGRLVGQRLSHMYLDKRNLHLLLVCGLFGTAPLWAVELKEAEITALKNIVEHDTGEGKGATQAHASEKIFEKSKLSTAAASMAELTFADTSITRVGANTSFSFQSKERLVKLDKGTVLINTPPGAGGATVDCGGVTAAVTGTTFMASVDGNGNKMFVLLEGAGGMKVTAGGKTTMVRAGQAASVGGGEGGGKKEDSGGGPGEKKAGGDKPGADTKDSGGTKESGGDNAGSGDGGKPKAAAPAPAADKGPGEGSAGGGKPPAAPTIQVFDVDVQKVVASTPLIQAFDKPLPSAQKIQATVEVQQAKMSEGKMESLGVEIVAVKADGDVLVGAPKVAAEAPAKKDEPKADAPAKKEDVVAKKEEVAGKKEDGGMKPEPKADAKMAGVPAPDNLDISTAAGGPAPAPAAAPLAQAAPAPKPPAPAPVVAVPPAASIVGQIINGAVKVPDPTLVGRAPEGTIVIGDPNNPFTISLSTALKNAARAVFTVTIGSITVSDSFSVGAGASNFSILGSSIPDPRIYTKGQTAVVSLTLPGTIGTITQTIKLDSRPLSDPVVQAANPLRALTTLKDIPMLTSFDKYFYFVGAIPGSMGALEKYFINAPGAYDLAGTTSKYIQLANTQKVELATDGEMQDFDFFAAQAIRMDSSMSNLPSNSSREDVFFYANQVLLGKQTARFSGATLNPLTMDDSFMEFWDGGWRDWAVLGGSVQGGVTLELPTSKEKVGFVAGTGGISIQGVTVGANGAALEVLTSGDLLVQAASLLGLSPVRETSFESLGRIQMGATTEELAALALIETSVGADGTVQTPRAAQEALQEQKQVRIVSAAGEAYSTGIAVVRSATGLEMRDVVIRGFGQIELAKGLGSDSLAPRVLVSGSSVRDFKIKELVGAFINADSKIQMAALDASGELAGTMVVQNGLPVNRQLAGVLDKTITDSRKNLLVDAQTVSLAARRLEFQNTTIAAMSAITARANTVLLNNANFTVIAQNGMINFYTQQGLVNRTYGSEVEGQLNFSGANSFRIGTTSFTVQDQATLNKNYGNNILDMNQNFGRPEAGKVNVLKM